MSKKLLVEGWRGINHSYAMVNQFQLLALKKTDIELQHHDLPFYKADWNLENNFCGLDSDAINSLATIGEVNPNTLPELTYRISFPFRFYPPKAGKLLVFGTTEQQVLMDHMVFDGFKPAAYKNTPLTIVTPSHWSKTGFLRAGFVDEQIAVVPHGVDLSIFKPIDHEIRIQYRSLLGADKESFVILSVGGMMPNKGIDVLFAAYIELKRKYPHIKIVLKDQSNLYGITANEVINQYCYQNNINITSEAMREIVAGVVCITDNLNLTQLNALYASADCYVSPYRAEGFNLPPLEAAAAGTPIIVTKGGATDDYIHESFALQVDSQIRSINNGNYLEPHLESLIEQIEKLINAKASAINQAEAIRYLQNGWGWENAISKLITFF
jgi:glycosyltransferase involved in cell wall biosynthesis